MNRTNELLSESAFELAAQLDILEGTRLPGMQVDHLLRKAGLINGKRIRPILTMIVGMRLGVDERLVSICAQAIELIHVASLAHDDVIDEATIRRGHPSINVASSNKEALLVGDYLLAEVFSLLATSCRNELVSEMSTVIVSMVEGEFLQLRAASTRQFDLPVVIEIARLKTGAAMSWCGAAPALCAGLPKSQVDDIRRACESLGIAFQMRDDILDFLPDSGKDPRQDIKNGLVNAVVLAWLEDHPAKSEDFTRSQSDLAL